MGFTEIRTRVRWSLAWPLMTIENLKLLKSFENYIWGAVGRIFF
jgi:hypothetical protein